MRTRITVSICILLFTFFGIEVSAQSVSIPRDTSYTAIGTYLKVKKQGPT